MYCKTSSFVWYYLPESRQLFDQNGSTTIQPRLIESGITNYTDLIYEALCFLHVLFVVPQLKVILNFSGAPELEIFRPPQTFLQLQELHPGSYGSCDHVGPPFE